MGILTRLRRHGTSAPPKAGPSAPWDLQAAHKHCSLHRAEIESSEVCGCFCCGAIYSPAEIVAWVDDAQTAICPHCPVDSIIGSASGYPITKEFLEAMHTRWF
ncbi:hypothetical protein SAMN05421819_0338 [Bryocella elongata]|uniref:Cytoplasmic protein n=1 Tax=Bryocella elongata TaxID=863522 RepID=A0A1H5SSK8_9BACT|nr:hypothetical protein SAMN05421819_0338 [Bryocella elongata]